MKNIFLLILTLLFATNGFAQISVNEEKKNMSKGMNTAYVLTFPEVETKTVEKAWKSFMKDYKAKPKFDKKTGEYFADNAKIKTMSDNVVDVYSTLGKNVSSDTELSVWFDLGGAYVNSETHPDQSAIANDMLMKFSFEASKELAEAVVKAEEKELDNLNDDLKKLSKDNKDYQQEIIKAEEKIAKMRAAIEANLIDQEAKKKEIKTQEGVLNEVKIMRDKYN